MHKHTKQQEKRVQHGTNLTQPRTHLQVFTSCHVEIMSHWLKPRDPWEGSVHLSVNAWHSNLDVMPAHPHSSWTDFEPRGPMDNIVKPLTENMQRQTAGGDTCSAQLQQPSMILKCKTNSHHMSTAMGKATLCCVGASLLRGWAQQFPQALGSITVPQLATADQ